MSHLALDTNAVSALFDGDEALTAVLVDVERLTIPVVVLGEYRYGLLCSRHRRKLEALLDSLATRPAATRRRRRDGPRPGASDQAGER